MNVIKVCRYRILLYTKLLNDSDEMYVSNLNYVVKLYLIYCKCQASTYYNGWLVYILWYHIYILNIHPYLTISQMKLKDFHSRFRTHKDYLCVQSIYCSWFSQLLAYIIKYIYVACNGLNVLLLVFRKGSSTSCQRWADAKLITQHTHADLLMPASSKHVKALCSTWPPIDKSWCTQLEHMTEERWVGAVV